MATDIEEHLAVFRRGVVDLIDEQELRAKLALGRPLRIKFGMDPSSPDLHVGHAIPLMKLRALQDLGHQIVLIVGSSTAMVGDPTGRNKLRPQLTREQVEINLATYIDQAGKVLDMERTEVHRNSDWFDKLDFGGLLALCGRTTVARMLERDTFDQRMKAGEAVGMHELLYPLLQGWDSVEIRADVELGGTDQLFNLLFGRTLQEQEGQSPQVCFTTPLINGSDGRKMSKSYGNAIAVTEEPKEMFGKIMRIPDEVMGQWFELLTDASPAQIEALLAGHPNEAKHELARRIVGYFHSPQIGQRESEAFIAQFRDKQLPDDIPDVVFDGEWSADGLPLPVLLRGVGLAQSSSDARRLIEQGAVRLDGEVVSDPKHLLVPPAAPLLIQVGKRRFARVSAKA
ncbi:tyrosine--tRNA ligase [Engelhardtia mirabilis]|uniref:Tyrosine--tRNA ligase n=1 Tax=Engelhardtia mirabilis TaxID=2528011 RepID=A0A518BKE9_9BACT|nr:Tyrosine--tRNA ligase [Planctomycetes bacterium Pla133]QDV01777.1 Tyrosine--tRNA ligase [Planctomycetes bacterium Pla86]